jgi:hypothetical protein
MSLSILSAPQRAFKQSEKRTAKKIAAAAAKSLAPRPVPPLMMVGGLSGDKIRRDLILI